MVACSCLRGLPFLAYTCSMAIRKAHGPAIRALRKALGVTQDDLAVSCDVSPGYMSRIESGEKQPSEKVVTAICLRLGINKGDITYTVDSQRTTAA